VVATVLTSVALTLVDHAIARVPTRVGEVFADGAFEEALAALAAVNTIVLSTRLSTTKKRNSLIFTVLERMPNYQAIENLQSTFLANTFD
jgi:hypothetical protein